MSSTALSTDGAGPSLTGDAVGAANVMSCVGHFEQGSRVQITIQEILVCVLPALNPDDARAFYAVIEPLATRAIEAVQCDKSGLGGRPRVPLRVVLDKIVMVVVGGLSYQFVADDRVGATTLRRYRSILANAGVFADGNREVQAMLAEYGGHRVEHIAIDGCHVKAPSGGEATGRSPVDRSRLGRKLSTLVDESGLPLVTVVESGNTHERSMLVETLDRFEALGLRSAECKTMVHLDAGYDAEWVMVLLKERGYAYEIACKYGDASHKTRHSKAERRRMFQARIPTANGGHKIAREYVGGHAEGHRSTPGNRASNRWHVERTFSWIKRGFKKLALQEERSLAIVEAWVDLAHMILGIRELRRRLWLTHRWEGRPERLRYPIHGSQFRAADERWARAGRLNPPPEHEQAD